MRFIPVFLFFLQFITYAAEIADQPIQKYTKNEVFYQTKDMSDCIKFLTGNSHKIGVPSEIRFEILKYVSEDDILTLLKVSKPIYESIRLLIPPYFPLKYPSLDHGLFTINPVWSFFKMLNQTEERLLYHEHLLSKRMDFPALNLYNLAARNLLNAKSHIQYTPTFWGLNGAKRLELLQEKLNVLPIKTFLPQRLWWRKSLDAMVTFCRDPFYQAVICIGFTYCSYKLLDYCFWHETRFQNAVDQVKSEKFIMELIEKGVNQSTTRYGSESQVMSVARELCSRYFSNNEYEFRHNGYLDCRTYSLKEYYTYSKKLRFPREYVCYGEKISPWFSEAFRGSCDSSMCNFDNYKGFNPFSFLNPGICGPRRSCYLDDLGFLSFNSQFVESLNTFITEAFKDVCTLPKWTDHIYYRLINKDSYLALTRFVFHDSIVNVSVEFLPYSAFVIAKAMVQPFVINFYYWVAITLFCFINHILSIWYVW